MGVRADELIAANRSLAALKRRFEIEVARKSLSWSKRAFDITSLGLAFYLGVKVGS